MSSKKTYSPPKTFDTSLEGVVNLLTEKKFSCSGINLEQCKQDVLQQRLSRATYDAHKASFTEAHRRFMEEQEERFRRFSQLFHAARGVYRDDPAMLAALANFQRKAGHRTSKAEAQQTSAAPAAQPSQVLPKIATA